MSEDKIQWEPFDPNWLIKLSKDQLPEYPWLPEALSKCTQVCKRSVAYHYFVDPSNPNKPGSTWQFEDTLELLDPKEGELILDVLVGNRIGGVEFINRIKDVL